MSHRNTSQSGFAHPGLVLLLIIVLGVVGGGGYYTWHKNHEQKQSSDNSQTGKKVAKVTNYDECLKAEGSIVQDSYPATCITKGKQRFTQPIEQKYLAIKEWGVKFPYPEGVLSLSYDIHTNAVSDGPQIMDIHLDDVPGSCKGTNMLLRAKSGQDLDGYGNTAEQIISRFGTGKVKKLGDYYYLFEHGQSGCTTDTQALRVINELSPKILGAKIQNLAPLE